MAPIIKLILFLLIGVGVVVSVKYILNMKTNLIRYIKLSKNNGNINIADIQVFDVNNTNVALTSTITMSSGTTSNNAADNKISTVAETLTKGVEYIQLDLGKDTEVNKIYVYNRGDCCQDKMIDCKITVLSDEEYKQNKAGKELTIMDIRQVYLINVVDGQLTLSYSEKTYKLSDFKLDLSGVWSLRFQNNQPPKMYTVGEKELISNNEYYTAKTTYPSQQTNLTYLNMMYNNTELIKFSNDDYGLVFLSQIKKPMLIKIAKIVISDTSVDFIPTGDELYYVSDQNACQFFSPGNLTLSCYNQVFKAAGCTADMSSWNLDRRYHGLGVWTGERQVNWAKNAKLGIDAILSDANAYYRGKSGWQQQACFGTDTNKWNYLPNYQVIMENKMPFDLSGAILYNKNQYSITSLDLARRFARNIGTVMFLYNNLVRSYQNTRLLEQRILTSQQEYIDFSNTVQPITNPKTISAFVKLDPNVPIGTRFGIIIGNHPNVHFNMEVVQNGVPRLYYNYARFDLRPNVNLQQGIWYNLTWVIKNQTTIEFYLNGDLNQTFTITPEQFPVDFVWNNIKVGYDNRAPPFYFAGSISKIMVSSDVLTAQQIKDNANANVLLDNIVVYDRTRFTPRFMENFRNNTYLISNGTSLYYDRNFEVSPCLILNQPITQECYLDIWKYYGCQESPEIPTSAIGKTVDETMSDIRLLSINTSDQQRMTCYGDSTNWPTRWVVFTLDSKNHLPVRLVGDRLECMSEDGMNCMWRSTVDSAELLITTPPQNVIPMLNKQNVLYGENNESWEAKAYKFLKQYQF
jgi:hypothetical protein